MIVSRRRLSVVSALAMAVAVGGPAMAQEAPEVPPIIVTPPGAPLPQRTPMPPLIAPIPAPDEGEDGEGPGMVVDTDAPPEEPEIVPIPAVWAPAPRDEAGRTAYGLYLGGRYLTTRGTEVEGAAQAGAAALVETRMLTPEQPTVSEQAFVAALLAGDLDAAVRSLPEGEGVSPTLSGAGRLVQAVMDFDRGDERRAAALLKSRPIDPPHANAALLVQPWIAAAARDWNLALIAPPAGDNPLIRVMRLQRAQLLEIRRRRDEAEAEYKALVEAPNSQPAFRVAYGEFLERNRRRDEAVALYAAASPTEAANPLLVAARARAASGGRPPRVMTPRQGASRALLIAASLAQEMRANQFAAVYSRLSLQLSPDDAHRLQYADALARARLEGPAREVLASIRTDDAALYTSAQAQLADSLARAERPDEAVAAYRRAVAASPNSAAASLALASQLVALKRNEEALALLEGPMLTPVNQSGFVRFLRGAAYEGLGRIEEAEAELQAAVAVQPDNAMYLNFLGYLWVDGGTKVDEGAALIARAFSAQPTDGNIQDSLGWAQYRQGRYDEAVVTLEGAVAKEPANAEINDHLGDAYWRVGRRREAGYQWTRVLTLDPDAERKAGAEKKLAEGLPPPEPLIRPLKEASAASELAPAAAPGSDAT